MSTDQSLLRELLVPRLPRCQQLGDAVAFHVINRGHNRETVFHDDDDRRVFLDLIDRYRARFGFALYHYCLMSNHFHLLLRVADARELSPLMAGLLRSYVHHCHRRRGFVGHQWQGRFKSPAVQDGAYLLSCGRYIERNPLAASMVQEPWDYAWSSCKHYALGVADPLVTESPSYTEFGADPQRRRMLWQDFLVHDDERAAAVREGDWAIGDEAFRKRMRQVSGRPAARRRGRPRRQGVTLEDVPFYDATLVCQSIYVKRHHFLPGSDALNPASGVRYDIMSGTASNLDLHAHRMADVLFRMIDF
jgi:putative transposase